MMEEKQNVSAAFYLGVTNECDANRQFPLHATREGFRASMSFVLEVQDADDPVHLIWDLIFGVAFQLCIEEQVLSDCKVIKQYVMLGTEAQTAADQSHVLTDVVPVDISSATGRGKQTWSTSAGELISSSDIFERECFTACFHVRRCCSPVSMDSVVVFPAPLCPRSTVICPSNMFSVRSRTACLVLFPTLNFCQ